MKTQGLMKLGILLILLLVSACQTTALPEPKVAPGGEGDYRQITIGGETLTYQVVDGDAVFQGDIILGTVEDIEAKAAALSTQAVFHDKECGWLCAWGWAGPDAKDYRWPGGVVPYVIEGDWDVGQDLIEANIERAINNEFGAKTSIRWIPRTNEADYIAFVDGSNCSSPVGRQGGRQEIKLNSAFSCELRHVIHEMGHAVGLWHEMSRSDRDEHIEIYWNNIKADAKSNYDRHSVDGLDIGDYDYASVMHYKRHFGGKTNESGIVQKAFDVIINGVVNDDIVVGEAATLSAGDAAALNWIYADNWVVSFTDDEGSQPLEGFRGSPIQMTNLAFADMNNNGSTDVLFERKECFGDTQNCDHWEVYYYDSLGSGTPYLDDSYRLADIAFGDFNGNGTTDVFRATGSRWQYKEGGKGSWLHLYNSSFTLDKIGFGDFNGNGTTDVFYAGGNGWYMKDGGSGNWQVLNSSGQETLANLQLADYNGNGTTDVIFVGWFYNHRKLYYKDGGSGSNLWGPSIGERSLSHMQFGQFDDDARLEVIHDDGNGVEVSGLIGTWQELNDYLGVAPYTVGSENVLGDFDGNGLTDIFATRYW